MTLYLCTETVTISPRGGPPNLQNILFGRQLLNRSDYPMAITVILSLHKTACALYLAEMDRQIDG